MCIAKLRLCKTSIKCNSYTICVSLDKRIASANFGNITISCTSVYQRSKVAEEQATTVDNSEVSYSEVSEDYVECGVAVVLMLVWKCKEG